MKVNHRASATLSLDGEWEFGLGDRARWGVIRVPGCWEAQGYSKTAEGPAFYRRTVTIPPTWAGQPIFLEFDAVSYVCAFSSTALGQGASDSGPTLRLM
jgi:beta-galactosidase/beta-glucuronidase